MTKEKPKVSVIIPTYNRADMIVQCLESVLNQTYKDFEVIVVDDGSTDDTPAIVRNYQDRIMYVRQERKGQSSATNLGLGLAKGEYVAFHDSDDVWLPGKLESQVAFLEEHQECAMVIGNGVYIDNQQEAIIPKRRGEILERQGVSLSQMFMKSSVRTPTILVRKRVVDSIGGLDPQLKSSIHLDLVFRVLLKHRVAFLNDVLVKIRRHSGERISTNEERRQIYNLKVIRKLLAGHPEVVNIIGEKNVKSRLAYRYYRLAKIYHARNDFTKALENIRRAYQYWPSLKYLFYRVRFDLRFADNSARDSSRGFVQILKDGFEFHMRTDCIRPSLVNWLKTEVAAPCGDYDQVSRHSKNRRAEVLDDTKQTLFVKRFFSPRLSYAVKDIFRRSKALNAWKASLMLSTLGFHTAPVAVVGEKRRLGLLLGSVFVTNEVPAPTIIKYLSENSDNPPSPPFSKRGKGRFSGAILAETTRRKRELIRLLGKDVGRMHLLGIVHGDLLPGNILVDESQPKAKFVFLDNDRTRKLLRTLPVKLVVRNLVQLGRFPLPGITLTDRLRFFKAYIEENPRFSGREKQLLNMIVIRTRERVLEIERLTGETAATLSFRALMSGKR